MVAGLVAGRDQRAEVKRGFGAPGQCGHHGHRFHRIFAGGCLAAQHDRIGPVHDRVGYIGRFGPGRPWVDHHRFQHLRGGDDRFADQVAAADQHLLNDRHIFGGNLDAQVAARHHHAIGHLQNIVDIADSGGIFNLGDDVAIGAARFQHPTDRQHIRGLLDERSSDEIDTLLDSEQDIQHILLR